MRKYDTFLESEMEVEEENPMTQMIEKAKARRARREAEDRDETTSRDDMLIMDTGGGKCSTVTERVWVTTQRTNHVCYLTGHQSKGTNTKCPIVNAATKGLIKGREDPVLLGMNHTTLVSDDRENESLCQPYDLMKHGMKVDLVPKHLGGAGGMMAQGEDTEESFVDFEWEEEENLVCIKTSKPTQEEIDTLEYFELTSPLPVHARTPHGQKINRKKQKTTTGDTPLSEWRKCLGMLPLDVAEHTLEETTQFYLDVECEDRDTMRDHIKSRFPATRLNRLNEKVATDAFFPSTKSDRGNACSQFFAGTDSH